jgi:hypothetical protein
LTNSNRGPILRVDTKERQARRPHVTNEQILALYERIEAVNPDDIGVVNTNRLYRKALAEGIRHFLRTIGFTNRDIRVKTAYCVEVCIPHTRYTYPTLVEWTGLTPEEQTVHQNRANAEYRRRCDVGTHLEEIILRAFPACGDRSDVMTDYFDFVFSVRN